MPKWLLVLLLSQYNPWWRLGLILMVSSVMCPKKPTQKKFIGFVCVVKGLGFCAFPALLHLYYFRFWGANPVLQCKHATFPAGIFTPLRGVKRWLFLWSCCELSPTNFTAKCSKATIPVEHTLNYLDSTQFLHFSCNSWVILYMLMSHVSSLDCECFIFVATVDWFSVLNANFIFVTELNCFHCTQLYHSDQMLFECFIFVATVVPFWSNAFLCFPVSLHVDHSEFNSTTKQQILSCCYQLYYSVTKKPPIFAIETKLKIALSKNLSCAGLPHKQRIHSPVSSHTENHSTITTKTKYSQSSEQPSCTHWCKSDN